MTVLKIVKNYSLFLSGIQIKHAIGGSLASSAWGEQRQTNDADFLVEISESNKHAFVKSLPREYHIEENEIYEAIQSNEPFCVFQVIYKPTIFKIDNFIAKSKWETQELERAINLQIEDVNIPFASPECIIIAKCLWFDKGNRVSDRQWNDLIRIYEVQKVKLDENYILKTLREFEVEDLWHELKRQSKV
jgi:hypothetical protein